MQLLKIISVKKNQKQQYNWVFCVDTEYVNVSMGTWIIQTHESSKLALCMQWERLRELKVLRNGTFVLY